MPRLAPSSPHFSHNRVIIALVVLLLLALTMIDLVILQQQRQSLLKETRHRAAVELEQAATFMTEPLLRFRFADIEQFIQQWSANNPEVVHFSATTPQGYILTDFQRPPTSPHRFQLEKEVSFADRHLLTLQLEKDYSQTAAIIAQLRNRLLLASLLISAALGAVLWWTFRRLAIRPLEQEIGRRRAAEAELAEANHLLEESVKARTRELETNHRETILTFVKMIEQRDTYTAGHTERVADYSRRIARQMGLTETETEQLAQAAILHDIGKIATPDAILLKPGQFTPLERDLIRLHAVAGYEMLAGIALYQDLAEIILHHHERHDGSGYPDRLAGAAIPLPARILAVADAFDAMTTNRIYQPRNDLAGTLKMLSKESGRQFHPEVVAAAIIALAPVHPPEKPGWVIAQDRFCTDHLGLCRVTRTPSNELERERFAYFFSDQLTGLYNEGYLKSVLQDPRYRQLDICHLHGLAQFNKQEGWEQGNTVLRLFAEELGRRFPDALLFRIYGNDFAILSEKEQALNREELAAFTSLSATGIEPVVRHLDLGGEEGYSIDKLERVELLAIRNRREGQ